MVEWFVEGLVKWLVGWGDWVGDLVVCKFYDCVMFYIVLNMNLDGSVYGNLCINVVGVNLNCEWMVFDVECSFEVLVVCDVIYVIGCDMFFDIYGDEDLLYVFVVGLEMLLSFIE